MSRQAFGIQQSLYHHLGGDAGVIRTHLPECVVALHAVVTNQGVHDGFLKAVPHMQAAGDIRWGDGNAIGFTLTGRLEVAFALPGFVPAGFYILRAVGFFHNGCFVLFENVRRANPVLRQTGGQTLVIAGRFQGP